MNMNTTRSVGLGTFGALVLATSIGAGIVFTRSDNGGRSASPARIRVEPRHLEMEPIVVGSNEPAVAYFKIENVGDQELVIRHIEPLCGCASVELSEKNLKPREVARLGVKLRANEKFGPLSTAVIIHSNDPTSPATRVTLAWEQLGAVGFEPPHITVDSRRAESEDATRATVFTYLPDVVQPQHVERVECWPPGINAEFVRLDSPTEQEDGAHSLARTRLGDLLVSVDLAKVGTHRTGWVRLVIRDYPHVPALTISWSRTEVLKVEPRLISFGAVMRGETLSRQIRLTSHEGLDFAITGAVPSTTRCRIKHADTTVASNVHELEVLFDAPDEVGAFRESIQLQSDIQGSAPLIVFFSGVVHDE